MSANPCFSETAADLSFMSIMILLSLMIWLSCAGLARLGYDEFIVGMHLIVIIVYACVRLMDWVGSVYAIPWERMGTKNYNCLQQRLCVD